MHRALDGNSLLPDLTTFWWTNIFRKSPAAIPTSPFLNSGLITLHDWALVYRLSWGVAHAGRRRGKRVSFESRACKRSTLSTGTNAPWAWCILDWSGGF